MFCNVRNNRKKKCPLPCIQCVYQQTDSFQIWFYKLRHRFIRCHIIFRPQLQCFIIVQHFLQSDFSFSFRISTSHSMYNASAAYSAPGFGFRHLIIFTHSVICSSVLFSSLLIPAIYCQLTIEYDSSRFEYISFYILIPIPVS